MKALTEEERRLIAEIESNMPAELAAHFDGRCFDREGNRISYALYIVYKMDHDYVRIARDEIGDAEVSTVWLGLDQGFMGEPLIFETMVFGGTFSHKQSCAATIADALQDHEYWVREIKTHLAEEV